MKGGEAARNRLDYHYFFPKGFVLYGTSLLPRKARAGSCGVNVFGEAGGGSDRQTTLPWRCMLKDVWELCVYSGIEKLENTFPQ